MIKAVLFDLDGTLLPMDEEIFIKDYFGSRVQDGRWRREGGNS